MKKKTPPSISRLIITIMLSTLSLTFAMETESDNLLPQSGTQSTTQSFAETAASQTVPVVYSSIPRTFSFSYNRDRTDGESKREFMGRVHLGYYPIINQSLEVTDKR